MLKLESIGTLNGRPRYYISCDEKIIGGRKIHSAIVENGKEELFCCETSVAGIYTFGCKQLTDGVYHKAGYVWSSRPGCINGQFGTKLVEAVINGAGFWYIDVNVLKPLVEDFVGSALEVVEYDKTTDADIKELVYKLEDPETHKEAGVQEEPKKWVDPRTTSN